MRIGFLFSFIFLSFAVSARSEDLCQTPNHFSELDDLFAVVKEIDWSPATDEQIKNAHCAQQKPFTDDEMIDWLDGNQSDLRFDKNINGISFEEESPERLEAFKYLTTFLNPIGEVDLEHQKTFTSSCKKVDCAVKEIFGDTGIQLLFMQQRFGMNGSHLVKKPNVASPWKRDELDPILLALSDYPSGLLPVEKNYTLIHANRDIDSNRMVANAVIHVFNPWNQKSFEQKRYAIFHELGHVIGNLTSIESHPKWMNISAWEKRHTTINGIDVPISESSKEETIVSKYGLSNEIEDFAESIVAYRYNPDLLKEVSPTKYELLKEIVFDDVEYTSKESCTNPNRISLKTSLDASEKYKDWKPSIEELTLIGQGCNKLALDTLSQKEKLDPSLPEFLNCLDESMASVERSLLTSSLSGHSNHEFMQPLVRNSRLNLSENVKNQILKESTELLVKELKDQLESITANDYYCKNEDNLKYAYQGFKEDKLGFSPYDLMPQLEKIVRKACVEKKPKDRHREIQKMFQ